MKVLITGAAGPRGRLLRARLQQEGHEVVQVYSSRSGAAWPEPLRKLVGFTRVHLQPGQAQRVTLTVPRDALALADGNGRLSIVPGLYRIFVGGGVPGQEPGTSGKSAVAQLRM